MNAVVSKQSYILESCSQSRYFAREMQVFCRFGKENWCQCMWPAVSELGKTGYISFLLYFVFQIKMVIGYFKQL